eukprot:GILJ01013210.1.p1 GENE.GILJ01013210.1~~GILJ01013210.1.p1  ORF type:complete len:344 (+),score=45.14 GILJ01013210.1:41-1072(+)
MRLSKGQQQLQHLLFEKAYVPLLAGLLMGIFIAALWNSGGTSTTQVGSGNTIVVRPPISALGYRRTFSEYPLKSLNFTRIHLPSSEAGGQISFWAADNGNGMLPYLLNAEAAFQALLVKVLSPICSGKLRPPNSIEFVDVGANQGFYTVLAASLGCRTVSFEMQPMCLDMLEAELLLNDLRNSVVVPHPVSSKAGSVVVSYGTPCYGPLNAVTSSNMQHKEQDRPRQTNYVHPTAGIPRNAHISLLKIDTEGFEADVLVSFEHWIHMKLIDTIVVEVTPSFWARLQIPRAEVWESFKMVLASGYRASLPGTLEDNPRDLSTQQLQQLILTDDFVQKDIALTKV